MENSGQQPMNDLAAAEKLRRDSEEFISLVQESIKGREFDLVAVVIGAMCVAHGALTATNAGCEKSQAIKEMALHGIEGVLSTLGWEHQDG